MSGETVNIAKNILDYVEELKTISNQIEILRRLKTLNLDQKNKLNSLNARKMELLSNVDTDSSKIYKIIFSSIDNPKIISKLEVPKVLPKPQIIMPKDKTIPISAVRPQEIITSFQTSKFKNLSETNKKSLMKELKISKEELKDFINLQRGKSDKGVVKLSLKKEDYTIYKPSNIGKFANSIMKDYADLLVNKYPKFFQPMFGNFKMVEMELLSRTYISMMLLFTLLSLPGLFLFFLALNFAFHLSILAIALISFFGMIFTFIGFYFYPASLIGDKAKKIKLELPFALVHMSAVAGSGAQPTSIFQLIADSNDYPELKKEIKKLLNYINLFGYNLSNALKTLAATTASPEFKELLNGMISTIETGGNLRGYLKDKADEALNTYKLDRRKQVEALSTYSEVYTAILIASPLLLLITLAIINQISGEIAGLSVSFISWLGILGALPLLNIGFMIFVNSSQKGI